MKANFELIMPKKIPLTRGQFAIVDDEDFDWLNQYKWCALHGRYTYYATRHLNQKKMVLMHREILKKHYGPYLIINKETDHKDRNGLNNQKNNLRISTRAENAWNMQSKINSTSKYKGVSFCKQTGQWKARIQRKPIGNIWLGRFDSEIKAAKAYEQAAEKFTYKIEANED